MTLFQSLDWSDENKEKSLDYSNIFKNNVKYHDVIKRNFWLEMIICYDLRNNSTAFEIFKVELIIY